VGLIALAGLDAETGVVMLLYLDHSCDRFQAEGRLRTKADLNAAVLDGAVQRIRPKIMTVCAIVFGLLPIMWSPTTQAGADVMKRIAAPMIGGVVTSAILELLLYPAIYAIWRGRHLPVVRPRRSPLFPRSLRRLAQWAGLAAHCGWCPLPLSPWPDYGSAATILRGAVDALAWHSPTRARTD